MRLNSGWKTKGGSVSVEDACREFNIDVNVIVNGINSGLLEYRKREKGGRQYFRVLRSQLINYIHLQQGGTCHLRLIHAQRLLGDATKNIESFEENLAALKEIKANIEILLSQI